MKNNQPWKQLHSGGRAYLGRPGEDADFIEMKLSDLPHSLACINRWGGSTKAPYTLAQHSVIVSRMVGKLGGDALAQLYGLLHDAHETVSGDMVTPAKEALPIAGRLALAEFQRRIDRAIYLRYGLPESPPPEVSHMIKRADVAAMLWEARDLLPGGPAGDWTRKFAVEYRVRPPAAILEPWDWERARDAFAQRQSLLIQVIKRWFSGEKQAHAERQV